MKIKLPEECTRFYLLKNNLLVRRKKIGIVFSNNENWIGGTYYFLNLVSSFLLLDDKDRPEVTLFLWEKKDFEMVQKTGYPYLNFINFYIPYSLPARVLNKFFPSLCKRYSLKRFASNQVDVVFPYGFQETLINIPLKVFWIPDFQERFYPDYFSIGEIESRNANYQKIQVDKGILILSSKSVHNDFLNFFPNASCRPKVVNFAVTHPAYKHLDIELLKNKFKIKGEYFFSPNQFWKHKNHLVILKAIKLLKEKNSNILVVFTGKEHDYRNPTYTIELKEFVIKNNLSDNVLFLGFIDREEQLQLMNHSYAVIQPSLFEGWSTVIEDAKAMNQFIIASDISVHREQLHDNCLFFNPTNENELADLLLTVSKTKLQKVQNDYTVNIKMFAESFMKAVNEI